jgi:hypothetical protein
VPALVTQRPISEPLGNYRVGVSEKSGSNLANGGWLGASAAARERASQRRAFYGVHPGDELTRAKPSLPPVHWLHRRPSMFWELPEREFARCRAQVDGPT